MPSLASFFPKSFPSCQQLFPTKENRVLSRLTPICSALNASVSQYDIHKEYNHTIGIDIYPKSSIQPIGILLIMEQSSSSCLAGNPFLSDSNSNEEADEAPDRKLPQLPALYPHSSSLGRKRDLDEMIASSSDAPLFSSDDILASTVEDYRDNDRRKRKSRRTWYAEEKVGLRQTSAPASKQKGRGPFVRSIDSGVWMGSDESVETDVESQ